MIGEIPWLENVGEAESVNRATELINRVKPDVLFLDIKMPGGTGHDILEKISEMPYVIFTTAYGEYAADAFDRNAVDYLLKPFSRRRFDGAIDKLRKRLYGQVDTVKIFTKSGNVASPLSFEQVDYFCADKDYVVAHCDNSEHLLKTTLKVLETELNSDQFVRAHRSFIVNISMIKSMKSRADRRIRIYFYSGRELLSSRMGAKILRTLIAR